MARESSYFLDSFLLKFCAPGADRVPMENKTDDERRQTTEAQVRDRDTNRERLLRSEWYGLGGIFWTS